MKTFKFSLMLRSHENTDVFISLDDNIYGIHSKRVNIYICFYFTFRENKAQYFMWIVDNSHEVSSLISQKKNNQKINKMLSITIQNKD